MITPSLDEFVIGEDNVPVLKKRPPKSNPFALVLREEVQSRMPERNLLDVLCLANHVAEWAYCFSPVSGSDPKIRDPIVANIVTTFSYGTAWGQRKPQNMCAQGSRLKILVISINHILH